MIPYQTDPRKQTLFLKQLLPKPKPKRAAAPTAGNSAIESVHTAFPVFRNCLRRSLGAGSINQEQADKIEGKLAEIAEFFADLARREKRLIGEAVTDVKEEDTSSLTVQLNMSYTCFCNYLDILAEALTRLRNAGHLSNAEFHQLLRTFEYLRQLHRITYSKLA